MREVSIFSPLGILPFRHLWLASFGSNLGTLIQNAAAMWVMTTLTVDASPVALVQTVASIPIVLFSLPAGALADIYAKRTIMLAAQAGMLVIALVLAVLATSGGISPLVLLTCLFLTACGSAFTGPSWQSSIIDLVPKAQLESAVTLHGAGFNAARSIGPALGGLVLAVAHVAAAFMLNALTCMAFIFTLTQWKAPRREHVLPPESMRHAILGGLRYVALSPSLLATIARASAFAFSGSSVLALVAVIVRDLLHGSSTAFGILLGTFGMGAVMGTLVRPLLLTFSREQVFALASILFGASAVLLGICRHVIGSAMLIAVAGMAWINALTGLNVLVQFITPAWVVGRVIAINQVCTYAGIAIGSWVWGSLADVWGVQGAMIASGTSVLGCSMLRLVLPLPQQERAELTPARILPLDPVEGPVAEGEGPIVVEIGYDVPADRWDAFVTAINDVGRIRRRNGALRWSLQQDIDEPTHWFERFHSPTWLDHLRRQTRSTVSDEAMQHRLRQFHVGRLTVRRLIDRRPNT